VLEALSVGGAFAFSVQTANIASFGGTTGSAALGTSVPAASSFIIGSYATAEASADNDVAGFRAYLSGCAGSPSLCSTVTLERYKTGGNTTGTVFVLAFASGDVRVQRGFANYTAGSQSQATATLGTAVNTAGAMAWNGLCAGPGG